MPAGIYTWYCCPPSFDLGKVLLRKFEKTRRCTSSSICLLLWGWLVVCCWSCDDLHFQFWYLRLGYSDRTFSPRSKIKLGRPWCVGILCANRLGIDFIGAFLFLRFRFENSNFGDEFDELIPEAHMGVRRRRSVWQSAQVRLECSVEFRTVWRSFFFNWFNAALSYLLYVNFTTRRGKMRWNTVHLVSSVIEFFEDLEFGLVIVFA